MKNKITLALLFGLLWAGNLLAQNKIVPTIVPANPEVTVDSLQPFFQSLSEKMLTPNATLNAFFATKISTYLSEASDLSLAKSYAVLDNSDGRLFIGGTFDKRQSTNDRLRFLLTAGIKANVKDGFASLFNQKGVNNDIGLSFKTTLFGSGSIWYGKAQKDTLKAKRQEIINELAYDFDTELTKHKRVQTGLANGESSIQAFIPSYGKEMKTKYTDKEAGYIIKKKLYNLSHTWWLSADVYVPVSESEYNMVDNLSSTNYKSTSYRPYELSIAYTNFWERNEWSPYNKWTGILSNLFIWKGVTLLTFKGSLLVNNSAKASLIKSYAFDEYVAQSIVVDTVSVAKVGSETVYVGKYEEFITPKLSARYVYMPFSFIGVSAAVEKSFGKVNDLNWRVGIPVSLKDKDGKSKINFELVWREVNKEHSFGLSIGLPIGQTIF